METVLNTLTIKELEELLHEQKPTEATEQRPTASVEVTAVTERNIPGAVFFDYDAA